MKSNLCSGCKEKPPLKKPEITQINDFMLRIRPHGLLCIDCLKKELSDEFERLKEQGQGFIEKRDGIIKVDWKMIDRLEEESQGFAYDVLLAMDTLSLSTEGNWQILADGGIMLNPRRFHSVLYFKEEQDVIDFATATLNNTLYSWEVQYVPKVITKSDIIGQK